MNRLKKIIFFAILLIGGLCAMNAQEKTTTAGVPVVKLNNGVEMPRFGLGTFLQGSNEICKQSCLTALRAGYRHIDTAHAYYDEEGVGEAVKEKRHSTRRNLDNQQALAYRIRRRQNAESH